MKFLLQRLRRPGFDSNKQYASELLSIFLHNSPENRLALIENDGMEILLLCLNAFRKRDPVDADETEYMENLFDALCSTLFESESKKLFLEFEGFELMLKMIK
jgi:beta-catenin-like protein 1